MVLLSFIIHQISIIIILNKESKRMDYFLNYLFIFIIHKKFYQNPFFIIINNNALKSD